MKPGRVVMLVLGTLSALLGLGLLAAAAGTGWLNIQQRDEGFFTSSTERFEASSNAITSVGLDIMVGQRLPDAIPSDTAGSILLRGASAIAGKDIFIGVARQEDVARYLDGVRRSEIRELNLRPFRVEYRDLPGTRTPARPGAQTFWAASATGAGTQELRWDLTPGSWAIVVMNADATAPVAADLQGGIRSDLLWPLFVGLLIAGIVLLAIGVPLIVAGAMGLGRHGPPPPRPTAGPPPAVPAGGGSAYSAGPAGGGAAAPPPPPAVGLFSNVPYPARLSGHLDPALSRWMWLVKWFLAIPHVIVLFFLWFALIVTSIVAWFAILFTARYPRSLFNFNVGVLRWSWRVSFYAFTAVGTDRYPPFTLAPTDYPADFDVDYPERLSRGLVLVKSWLLAIPHLLIVGVLAGTSRTWVASDDDWSGYGARYAAGGSFSLIALLTLIAAVILLFTGRYLPSLFDLLLGLNRWVYRVTAYVALMRDEYPPFRLDMGPADPGETLLPTNPPKGQS
jgi:ABC-type multidrug transport system fused ATPase/permease subunit